MNATTVFAWRALGADGRVVSGETEAASAELAIARLRREGARPLEVRAVAVPARRKGARRDPALAQALAGELAVLLGAGLPLDRALALAIGNIEDRRAAAAMGELLRSVREGAPLSRAMREQPGLFAPAEAAMAEAGETGGRLAEAMARLSAMLEQAAELRRMVTGALLYPAALLTVATGVVLLMLLFVVPQFEHLVDTGGAELPTATRVVMGASRFVRDWGLVLLAALVGAGFALARAIAQPATRARIDGALLGVPMLGELLRRIDTARFAHTLAALLEGGVALPHAMALAQATITNARMAAAIGTVAGALREGQGLAGPLAASGALPPIALGFVRTGEETSQLGPMLARLGAVLDRDVRVRLERLTALLTPAITVLLGTVVATIIAAILSAILGFNDLAVAR